ncbi:S-layer homology domain-containing protein [Paenibacillus sp. TAB 01]|uniref:S-layer homology domain-containing protein n=1 Tax=Paenibacillus sp. TAB 01 TaxID=3368988 RepID=UPI0037531333
MKKHIALLSSAALAFSMFASAALADTPKKASDYKDLTSVDAALQAKIDTLLSKGIFEGVSDDTFGIDQQMTRAQFAKVAALVFGLKVDMNVSASSFTDVRTDDAANGWAVPYIEAARAAGLVDGVTATTFAPGDPVTVGQLDTLFLKGLGHQVDVTASPWYADAVKQASALGIHPSDKNGDAVASRADLVTGAYGSLPASPDVPQEDSNLVSVTAAQANGEHAVDIRLDRAVDTSAAKLTLTKNGTVIDTKTAWSSDKKLATLTLSDEDEKLTNGTYKVTLSGIDSLLVKTAYQTFTIGTPGPSSTTGDISYSIPDSYVLKDVIDSGITGLATGSEGYVSQTEAENPTLSMFAKEIEIIATDKSGNEVAIPGIIQSITSSNPSVVKAAVSSDHKGYVLGNKAGTANVSVVYSTGSDNKTMTIPVEVKSDAVTAELIEARDMGSYQYMTVNGSVYSGLFDAYQAMDLLITDNYGIEYEQDEIQGYNFALTTILTPEDIVGDPNNGPVGTVTIDTSGIVHVDGNVTGFTLVAKLPNGKRAATDIHMRQR